MPVQNYRPYSLKVSLFMGSIILISTHITPLSLNIVVLLFDFTESVVETTQNAGVQLRYPTFAVLCSYAGHEHSRHCC